MANHTFIIRRVNRFANRTADPVSAVYNELSRRVPSGGFSMHPLFENWVRLETRRQFFARGMSAVGAAALATLTGRAAPTVGGTKTGFGAAMPETHFPAKAKNVIY